MAWRPKLSSVLAHNESPRSGGETGNVEGAIVRYRSALIDNAGTGGARLLRRADPLPMAYGRPKPGSGPVRITLSFNNIDGIVVLFLS